MLKLNLIIVDTYDKLLTTDRIIYNNEPSFTKQNNERDNFRYEFVADFDIFTIRKFFTLGKKEKRKEKIYQHHILFNILNYRK